MNPAEWSSQFIYVLHNILLLIDKNPLFKFEEKFDILVEDLFRLYKVTCGLSNQDSKELFIRLLQLRFLSCFLSKEEIIGLHYIFSKDEWFSFVEQIKNNKYRSLRVVDELDLIETWILEGYGLKGICEASEGDIVIDGGAHTGNTAIYFSQKVGDNGQVYAFEPSPLTFSDLKDNISDYNIKNVHFANFALSNFIGKANFPNSRSTGASLYSKNATVSVDVTTLDNYCLTNNIVPTFIKLDIEGAEVEALNGAREIIKKYHPKMAISIYHKFSDFADIPELILDINPNYEFYIKHSSGYIGETVLFCKPVDYKNQLPALSPEEIEPIVALKNALISHKEFIQKYRQKYRQKRGFQSFMSKRGQGLVRFMKKRLRK